MCAFRQDNDKKRQWRRWCERFEKELRATGIPEYILEDEMRFFVMLEHEYDDWERENDPWEIEELTPDQARALRELLADQFPEYHQMLVRRLNGIIDK